MLQSALDEHTRKLSLEFNEKLQQAAEKARNSREAYHVLEEEFRKMVNGMFAFSRSCE
jgi:hypothetical protein